MKKVYKSISIFFVVIFSLLSGKDVKAAASKDVNSRVNKIRSVLKENSKEGNVLGLSGKDVSNQDLSEWVNWGNWGNWNNWNNWRNWNNWGNWGNY